MKHMKQLKLGTITSVFAIARLGLLLLICMGFTACKTPPHDQVVLIIEADDKDIVDGVIRASKDGTVVRIKNPYGFAVTCRAELESLKLRFKGFPGSGGPCPSVKTSNVPDTTGAPGYERIIENITLPPNGCAELMLQSTLGNGLPDGKGRLVLKAPSGGEYASEQILVASRI